MGIFDSPTSPWATPWTPVPQPQPAPAPLVMPYSGDPLTYGERPEHLWFAQPGGAPGSGATPTGGLPNGFPGLPTAGGTSPVAGGPSPLAQPNYLDTGGGSYENPGTAPSAPGGPGLGGLSLGGLNFGGPGEPGVGPQGWGTALGLVGSLLGIAGLPGAGIVGSAIGTGIDLTNANRAIDATNTLKGPMGGISPLGIGAIPRGMLDSALFGLPGLSVANQARANAFAAGRAHMQANPSSYGLNADLSFDKAGSHYAPGTGATSGPGDSYGGYDKSGYDAGGLSSEPTGNVDGGWQDAADSKGSGDPGLFARGGGVRYTEGGEIEGEGDGQSDEVPALIEGQEPARLSVDENVVPADVVSFLGAGSSRAGHRRLRQFYNEVRQQATGQQRQVRPVPENLLMRLARAS